MQLYEEQPVLSSPTDTAVPVTPVPIFYLHGGERAFCSRPGCLCHQHAAQLKALLQAVLDGDLKLREVYNGVLAGKGIQECP